MNTFLRFEDNVVTAFCNGKPVVGIDISYVLLGDNMPIVVTLFPQKPGVSLGSINIWDHGAVFVPDNGEDTFPLSTHTPGDSARVSEDDWNRGEGNVQELYRSERV